jgi:nitrate reductase NapAB chaperone NapD
MEPQRFKDIKKSLGEMSIEELQEMSDDLDKLISVLMTRQVAIEDTILDKLEEVFAR